MAKSDGSVSHPEVQVAGFVRRSGRDSNPRGLRLAVFKAYGPVCGAWTVSVKQAGVDPRVTATVMATGIAVTADARLREAAQDVVRHWFDLVEGDADEALRRSMLALREAVATPPAIDDAGNSGA
jgi:hypothetical protein